MTDKIYNITEFGRCSRLFLRILNFSYLVESFSKHVRNSLPTRV